MTSSVHLRYNCILLLLLLGCTHQKAASRIQWSQTAKVEGIAPEAIQMTQPQAMTFSLENDLLSAVDPNNRLLVYVSERHGRLGLWVRDFADRSTKPINFSETGDYDPAFGRGGVFTFVSRRNDAHGDIYWSKSLDDVEDAVRLTSSDSRDRQPVFSADAKYIFFTSSIGSSEEKIMAVSIEGDKKPEVVTPGPGFDPAPTPDGKYLVYSEPTTKGTRLVVLRLADKEKRYLTGGDYLEGLATAAPSKDDKVQIVFVRFRKNQLDKAIGSLWQLDLNLDKVFKEEWVPKPPFPMTDIDEHALFPRLTQNHLWYTRGQQQQDIYRLPSSGMLGIATAENYLQIGLRHDDERVRLFALQMAYAASEGQGYIAAQSMYELGRFFLGESRLLEASRSFRYAAVAAKDLPIREDQPWGAFSELELLDLKLFAWQNKEMPITRRFISELSDWRSYETPCRSDENYIGCKNTYFLADIRKQLEIILLRYNGVKTIVLRSKLSESKIALIQDDKIQAYKYLRDIQKQTQNATQEAEIDVALQASLKQLSIQEISFDSIALSSAFENIVTKFPGKNRLLRYYAREIAKQQLEGQPARLDPQRKLDGLRQLIGRFPKSLIQIQARWLLVEALEKQSRGQEVVAELHALVNELNSDRAGQIRALTKLARWQERNGDLASAEESWRILKKRWPDAAGSLARRAIAQVALRVGRAAEAMGQADKAREAYRRVLDNEPEWADAYRSFVATSARTHQMKQAEEVVIRQAEVIGEVAVIHYARGLIKTWESKPNLQAALKDVNRAIALDSRLTLAYLTRGWIYEMMELDAPGFWWDVQDWLTELLRSVGFGSFLPLRSSNEDRLDSAVEDYKTALQLNQESVNPELESQILLNLGNAYYRLGDDARDRSNVELAYSHWLRALQFDLRFSNVIAEVVFLERLARAAIWSEQPTTAVMATRKAIEELQKISPNSLKGYDRRLNNLRALLAMSYTISGDDSKADNLFGVMAQTLSEPSRKAIMLRNQARAKFGRTMSTGELEESLNTLESSWFMLSDEDKSIQDSWPGAWFPVVENPSRAQFGFDTNAEKTVNLSLAQEAYHWLGEEQLKQELMQVRLQQNLKAFKDGGNFWFFGNRRKSPVVLGMLQEHIGLRLQLAKTACLEGKKSVAYEHIDRSLKLVDQMLSQKIDLPLFLLTEKARLRAFELEFMLTCGLIFEEESRLTQSLANAEILSKEILDSFDALVEDEQYSIEDIVQTSSVAQTLPSNLTHQQRQQAAVALRTRLAQTRVAHIISLRIQDEKSIAKDTTERWINILDDKLRALKEVSLAYRRIIMMASKMGPGLATEVYLAALDELIRVEFIRAELPQDVLEHLSQVYLNVATAMGELKAIVRHKYQLLLFRLRKGEDPRKIMIELRDIYPGLLEINSAIFKQIALDAFELDWANKKSLLSLQHIDQMLLFDNALGHRFHLRALGQSGVVGYQEDVEPYNKLANLLRTIKFNQQDLAKVPSDRPEQFRSIKKNISRLMQQFEDHFEDKAELSELPLHQRRWHSEVLARSQIELLETYLLETEALIIPMEDTDKKLHVLLVYFNEDGDLQVERKTTNIQFVEIQELLKKASIQSNAQETKLVKKAIFEYDEIEAKSSLIVIDGYMKNVISSLDLADKTLSYAHDITSFCLSRLSTSLGVSGVVRFVDSKHVKVLAEEKIEDEQVLSPVDAKLFMQKWIPQDLIPGQQRSLKIRPFAQKIVGAAQSIVVIEAPVQLEPHAPRRSRIKYQITDEQKSDTVPAPAALDITLEHLRLPANTLILGHVKLEQIVQTAAYSMSLDLSRLGYSVVILCPDDVPKNIFRNIVKSYAEKIKTYNASKAWALAKAPYVNNVPSLRWAIVRGTPGFTPKERKSFAQADVFEARREALSYLRTNSYPEAAVALKRLIGGFKELGMVKQMARPYAALNGIYARRLDPPDIDRSVDSQQAWLNLLISKKADEKKISTEWMNLARRYSEAQDYEQAEIIFRREIESLNRRGQTRALAEAYYQLARHYLERESFEESASTMEKAIELYERMGEYQKDRPSSHALLAVNQVGIIYLRFLNEPSKAHKAYLRALKYAKTKKEQIARRIDLARVARRRGDFAVAMRFAEEAQKASNEAGDLSLLLAAVIERTNVDWYRADYKQAERNCQESLSLINQISSNRKKAQNLEILALSVCGLAAMSQQRRLEAIAYLSKALAKAENHGVLSEVATQLNNLGRVHLEFGELKQAQRYFSRALQLDELRKDRYALAYDNLNLGRLYIQKEQHQDALDVLKKSLAYARQVKDTNSELQALYTLNSLEAIECNLRILGRASADLGARRTLRYRKRIDICTSFGSRASSGRFNLADRACAWAKL